jgi:hypothetical protein
MSLKYTIKQTKSGNANALAASLVLIGKRICVYIYLGTRVPG